MTKLCQTQAYQDIVKTMLSQDNVQAVSRHCPHTHTACHTHAHTPKLIVRWTLLPIAQRLVPPFPLLHFPAITATTTARDRDNERNRE